MQRSFKTFLEQDEKKTSTAPVPMKSVQYLEDLDINDFIDAVENISKMIATEKLDGTALMFGFDNDGNFYTSRKGKGTGKLFYEADDYGMTAAANGFKAAHAALQRNLHTIKPLMQPGQACDIEVLYGRQPNAITYGVDGKNFIAFLKPAEGTNSSVPMDYDLPKKLAKALKGKETSVNTVNVNTVDGINLIHTPAQTTWDFVTPERIDSEHLETVNVKKEIKNLRKFLETTNKTMAAVGVDMTNYDVATISLVGAKGKHKTLLKDERENIRDKIFKNYKLPIKEKILDKFVRKIKPRLQGPDITDDENVGMEGIVFLDPDTGKQFKIIDTDVFKTINNFNYEVRLTVKGKIQTDDPYASLVSRGGIIGAAMIRMVNLFDIPGLARPGNVKKILRTFEGNTPQETVANMASSLTNMDWRAAKDKSLSIIENAEKDLDAALEKFKEDYPTYKIKINNKKIGYSPEVVRRTLLVFAEARRDLRDLALDLHKIKSLQGLIVVFFGRKIKELHGMPT